MYDLGKVRRRILREKDLIGKDGGNGEKIDVSVVIPCLKRGKALDTVRCLEGQTVKPEVVVADYPGMNISEARNQGVKECSGDIVGFTDDDCRPHRDWVENALQTFEETENEDVVGVEGLTYGGQRKWHDWGYMGCNIFYRKSVLRELGGFDEGLAGWMEDTDLAWRALKNGYEIRFNPKVRVFHGEVARAEKSVENRLKMFKRHPYMFFKNYVVKRFLTFLVHRKELRDRERVYGKY